MGFNSLSLLVIFSSLLCLQSKVDSDGTVFFIDSKTNQFIRTPPRDVSEIEPMSLSDVGAAVSVLLGFAPPATLSAASSSKLNGVLSPNPFNRPRAVFMLEVKGTQGSQLRVDIDNSNFGTIFRSGIVIDSEKVNIDLPGEDEVSVVSLDELVRSYSDGGCTDKDISDFASWLGGFYVTDTSKQSEGKLTVSLPNGIALNLDLSKKGVRELTSSLVSLVQRIRRAVELHQDSLDAKRSPAEILTGCFDGIKILQEQYGSGSESQQGMKLFLATISKLFDSLQAAYKGQIVGVIFLDGTPHHRLDSMLNVKITRRPSSRSLEGNDLSSSSTVIRVLLIRTTLAWVTGIIFLIATLFGIYYLMYMPITRDTLLYSNVKLD